MASRAFAFVIWALVAASAVFWLLRLASSPRPVPAHALMIADSTQARGDLGRLFGREAVAVEPGATPVAEGSPFKLVGVVAPRAGSGMRAGVALIAVEGKPARPYRVGAAVDSELVLLGVHQRGASLGPRDGRATLTLELPALPPPATGRPGSANAEPPDAATPTPAQPQRPTGGPRLRLPPPVTAPSETPEPPAPVDEEPPSPAPPGGAPPPRS